MGLGLYEENDIQNVANAIRSKGVEGTFKVSEMANAIGQISGGEDYVTKNLKSLRKWMSLNDVEAGYIYYPSEDRVMIIPIEDSFGISLTFNGDTSNGLYAYQIRFDKAIRIMSYLEQQTSGWFVTGVDPSERNFESSIYSLRFDGNLSVSTMKNVHHPFLYANSELRGLVSERTHPVILKEFLNNKGTLINAIDNLKVYDVYRVTNVPSDFNINDITKGIIFFGNNSMQNTVIACGNDDSASVTRIKSSGYLASQSSKHFTQIVNTSGSKNTYIDISLVDRTGVVHYADGGSLHKSDGVIFTTYDIMNDDGTVFLEANTTIEEFKAMFSI